MSIASAAEIPFGGAVIAGFERLVHPGVGGGETRALHARFIAVGLIGAFAAATLLAALLPPLLPVPVTLAAACSALVAGWLFALLPTVTRGTRLAAALGLATAAAALALIVAAAGGLAGPMALLALALPLEAWWIARRRNWVNAAAAAALGSLAAAQAICLVYQLPTEPAAWHWIAPAIYTAALVARLRHAGDAAVARVEHEGEPLESVIDAVVVRMTPAGEVTDAGDKTRALLGLPRQLLLGTGLFDRVHVADRIAYLSALADLREGAVSRRIDIRVRLPRRDGEAADTFRPFELELAAAACRTIFVGVLRDNEPTAALRSALAEALDAADSTELAKRHFLAAVSHELRTPLNAILGFSDMMLQEICGSFSDPRQKEYVGLIHESGEHLLGVVNAILDVSKIESGAYAITPESFRFRDAAETCHAMMRLQAEAKNLSLSVHVTASVGEITADRRAVQQMLINLMSNAIKFTPAGGSISVGASRIGSRLHFWVNDTGIGVAEQDLARIGKPFMQIQNGYTRGHEGTGLGLSLVKGLVSLHQGTMMIESAPGQGTMVTISLPVNGPTRDGVPDSVQRLRNSDSENSDGELRKTA